MDYVKLSDEKLDEIMKAIRAENSSESKRHIANTSSEKKHTYEKESEFEVFNDCFQRSLKGMQIGLNKSPMHHIPVFLKPFARIVEKLYLRIAEFTNRDARAFNSNVVSMFAQFKLILEESLSLREEALLLDKKVNQLECLVKKYEKILYNLVDELHDLKSKKMRQEDTEVLVSENSDIKHGIAVSSQFYHVFEENFRGTQEDIKTRLQIYLPFILEHFTSLESKVFIDIGCGRGEFMETLKDNGAIIVIGVDLNEIQLDICKKKGLDVIQSDCIDYLRKQQDDSVDMISGIQIIEHFSLDTLIQLFKECKRLLKPGGIFLFETPNPDNLRTAATYFYLDPTHIRPIHKDFATFIAKYSGFENICIIEANPVKDTCKTPPHIPIESNHDLLNSKIESLSKLVDGPQDYSIIGIKE